MVLVLILCQLMLEIQSLFQKDLVGIKLRHGVIHYGVDDFDQITRGKGEFQEGSFGDNNDGMSLFDVKGNQSSPLIMSIAIEK